MCEVSNFYVPTIAGKVQLSRTSIAIESSANGGHLLPILADGSAAEDGHRYTAVHPVHQTERHKGCEELRTGQGAETATLYRRSGNHSDPSAWIQPSAGVR